jgi:alanine racemase
MVRCGCALYGYCVEIEQHKDIASPTGSETVVSMLRKTLLPVMTWKTRVASVRELAAGESVGYNAIFTAKKPMRLAMIPVGYADGLRRGLSGSDERSGGWVMLRGRDGLGEQTEPSAPYRAAIVGRISMNLTMVDITDLADVRIGDEAVVLGDGITADDHARLAGTIPYEILCAVRA